MHTNFMDFERRKFLNRHIFVINVSYFIIIQNPVIGREVLRISFLSNKNTYINTLPGV